MDNASENVKLTWALRLVAQGFRIHPLQPNSKIPPAGSEWKADATRDPAIIRRWFADNPSINYLVAPDEDHFILDVDVKGERDGVKNLRALQDAHGDIAPTSIIKTPSGGYHIYFQGSAPNSVGKKSLGGGIDIRGNVNGRVGYVVGPGSSIGGKFYEVDTDAPIAAAPDWLIDLCRHRTYEPLKRTEGVELGNDWDREQMRKTLMSLVDEGDVAVEGCGGHERTYRLFCNLLDYAPPEMALALVKEIWNPACQPPWSDEELETICGNAVKYRQNEIGAKASISAKVAFKGYKPEQDAANDEGPEDIFAHAAPSEIVDVTRDMLPDVIADFAFDAAERIGCTASMVAIPALVLASGCLHDKYKLQPRALDTSWLESARLWAMVIDRPSGAKSPAADSALAIANVIDAEWRAKYMMALAHFEQEQKQYQAEQKANAEPPDVDEALFAPRAPTERRLLANTFTVEGLREVLVDNPAGVFVHADELAELFGGLNQYKGGSGGDRQMLVQLNEGKPLNIDRAKKRSHVPNWGASVYGTIQPGVLAAIVHHRSLTTDGLFQRFMPFYGKTLGKGIDRKPDHKAVAAYERAIRRLTGLPVPNGKPVVCTLAPDARAFWDKIEDLRWVTYQRIDINEGLGGFLGKFPKFFARLVMTLHAIECAAQDDAECRIEPVVSRATVERAYQLMMQFFYPQALRVYGMMFTPLELEAKWTAEYILAHCRETVTLRELKRAHAAFNQNEELARNAMALLQERRWAGEPVQARGGRGGGVSVSWPIDPSVHIKFADLVPALRARRGERGAGLDAA